MNTKHTREDLLNELERALEMAGANPSRWPKSCCARLSAFIEADEAAARLYAEHKVLDRVLCCAPQGSPRLEIEKCVITAAFALRQNRGSSSLVEMPLGGSATRTRLLPFPIRLPTGSLWGEVALLAASLVLGVYIGASGDAVPALRGIDMLASSTDGGAGVAFAGSLFEPSGLHEQEQL